MGLAPPPPSPRHGSVEGDPSSRGLQSDVGMSTPSSKNIPNRKLSTGAVTEGKGEQDKK